MRFRDWVSSIDELTAVQCREVAAVLSDPPEGEVSLAGGLGRCRTGLPESSRPTRPSRLVRLCTHEVQDMMWTGLPRSSHGGVADVSPRPELIGNGPRSGHRYRADRARYRRVDGPPGAR